VRNRRRPPAPSSSASPVPASRPVRPTKPGRAATPPAHRNGRDRRRWIHLSHTRHPGPWLPQRATAVAILTCGNG
jgi:hypothetical protein